MFFTLSLLFYGRRGRFTADAFIPRKDSREYQYDRRKANRIRKERFLVAQNIAIILWMVSLWGQVFTALLLSLTFYKQSYRVIGRISIALLCSIKNFPVYMPKSFT